jgi:hypothetical protein
MAVGNASGRCRLSRRGLRVYGVTLSLFWGRCLLGLDGVSCVVCRRDLVLLSWMGEGRSREPCSLEGGKTTSSTPNAYVFELRIVAFRAGKKYGGDINVDLVRPLQRPPPPPKPLKLHVRGI